MDNDKVAGLKAKRAVSKGISDTSWFLYRMFTVIGNVMFVLSFIVFLYVMGHDKDVSFIDYMGKLWVRSKFGFFGLIFLCLLASALIRGMFKLLAGICVKIYGAQKSPDVYDEKIRKAENEVKVRKRVGNYRSVKEEMDAFRLSSNYFVE